MNAIDNRPRIISNKKRINNENKKHARKLRGDCNSNMITIVHFVIALYMYYARSDDMSFMNVWIMLTLPPTLLLFSR